MTTIKMPLRSIAYARSGDKGSNSNIGLIAYTEEGYKFLLEHVTAEAVATFFQPLGAKRVERYELPNLLALNFILIGALGGGASLSLRVDSQGKALGQALLEMPILLPAELLASATRQQEHQNHKSDSNIDAISLVTVERPHTAIAVLGLNRPEKRNALNIALLEALCSAIELLLEDESLRVLIIYGHGCIFCAGLDLHEASQESATEHSARLIARLLRHLHSSRLFTIAAAHGAAVAGGAGIMAACDYAIAAEETYIAFPEVHKGLVPAMVTALLSRQLGSRSLRELLLLGEKINLIQACHWGLINRISRKENYLNDALDIAHNALRAAPHALAHTKRFIDESHFTLFDDELQQALLLHQQMRHSPEAQEGCKAFLEKRPACWAK